MVRAALLAGVLLLPGCSGLPKAAGESQGVAWQPLCVGRYAVALPPDSVPMLEVTFHYVSVERDAHAAPFSVLQARVADLARKMRGVTMVRNDYSDRLYRAGGGDPDKMFGSLQLMGVREDSALGQVMIGFHPKPDSPDVKVVLHKATSLGSYTFQAQSSGADQYQEVSHDLWQRALSFQPLAEHVFPEVPGFCTGTGFFPDQGGDPIQEQFSLFVRFKNHPDATFSLDSNANHRAVGLGENTVEERYGGAMNFLLRTFSGVHALTRGRLEAAGQEGYQAGMRAPDDVLDGATQYHFSWAANGARHDASRPLLEAELSVQPRAVGDITLADDRQAEALWKQLLDGIHIRPGAVAGSR